MRRAPPRASMARSQRAGGARGHRRKETQVRIARSQIRRRVLVRTLIAVPLSLALALMATNVATAAGQPFDASGTSVGTGVELSNFRYAPPCGCVVTFLDLTATGTMSGTFQ